MSWASHNPELYDDMIRAGILRYLEIVLTKNGLEPTLEAFVELLQQDAALHHVYDALMSLANKEICDAEGDYFAQHADLARKQYKDRGI